MSQEADNCPIRQVLAAITGKWQILILVELKAGALRFGVIKRKVGDISQRVLTEKLRSMERDGYLSRSVHSGPPVAVSYELTMRGKELVEQLLPLVHWSAKNHSDIEISRNNYDER